MKPFEGLSADFLSGHRVLRSVRNRYKQLGPIGYVFPSKRQDRVAVFVFPRLLDERPTFDLADHEVEFAFDRKSFKVRMRFKLDRMLTSGVLDQ